MARDGLRRLWRNCSAMTLAGELLDGLPAFLGDAGTVTQSPRHRGHRNAQFAGDILHRHVLVIVHVQFLLDMVIVRNTGEIITKIRIAQTIAYN